MRKIVIDTEKCVGCGDCSLICPVSVYTLWRDLSEDEHQRISQLSPEKRHISFTNVKSTRAAKKAKQLAAKIFAYMDVEGCLGDTCRQCIDNCWKGAITNH